MNAAAPTAPSDVTEIAGSVEGESADVVSGATVCAQLEAAGRQALARAGIECVPPPGITPAEMINYPCDQAK